jgi:hypothetical protein
MQRAKQIRDFERERLRVRSSDRRFRSRGNGGGEPERANLVSMIIGTYREMPGLSLSLNQAARLFGLRSTTCQIVLDDLVRAGHLRRASDGQYSSL